MNPEKIDIIFRPLQKNDIKLLFTWLNKHHVKIWYGKEKKYQLYQNVEKHYLPRTKKDCLTKAYIIYIDQNPIGYIQTYKIVDYPDYNQYVKTDQKSAGMDLFIGEEDYLYRGIGPETIKKFLSEIVFKITGVDKCIIGPEPDNLAAIKAYEKAGFIYWKTIKNPEEAEYLMIIRSNL